MVIGVSDRPALGLSRWIEGADLWRFLVSVIQYNWIITIHQVSRLVGPMANTILIYFSLSRSKGESRDKSRWTRCLRTPSGLTPIGSTSIVGADSATSSTSDVCSWSSYESEQWISPHPRDVLYTARYRKLRSPPRVETWISIPIRATMRGLARDWSRYVLWASKISIQHDSILSSSAMTNDNSQATPILDLGVVAVDIYPTGQ